MKYFSFSILLLCCGLEFLHAQLEKPNTVNQSRPQTQSASVKPMTTTTNGWVPFLFQGQWGYKDSKGDVVIEPTLDYDYCWKFSDGLARVQINGYYYYINSAGSPINSVAFDEARDFSEGVAAVKSYKTNKWSFIDATCKYKFYQEFDFAYSFYDHRAIVWTPKEEYFIDITGKKLFDRNFAWCQQFQSGFAIVQELGSQTVHFINESGNSAFQGSFKSALPFDGGLAVVTDTLDNIYVINKSGQKIRTLDFRLLSRFDYSNGAEYTFYNKTACAADTGFKTYFFVNWDYEKISETYKWATPFNADGIAAVKNSNDECYYVNSSFQARFSSKFIAINNFREGMLFAAVRAQDSLWKLMNVNGETVKGVSSSIALSYYCGFSTAKVNGEFWYLNYLGEKRHGPYQWCGSFSSSCGLAPVQGFDNKCYFISRDGLAHGQYNGWTFIGTFNKGYAPVGDGNTSTYFIDAEMNKVFNRTFERASVFNSLGYAKVRIAGKWGLIDESGRTVVPCTYDNQSDCPSKPAK